MKSLRPVATLSVLLILTSLLLGGVSKEIQTSYIQAYQNKAMFLKIPIRGERQVVRVGATGINLQPASPSDVMKFKVGDQVRITKVDFNDSSVEFEISSTDLVVKAILAFEFGVSLAADFPERSSFDEALGASFTEGLSYREIDLAKEEFIKSQFDSLLKQFATTTGTSVDFVVKTVSEMNPDYRAAKEQTAQARARAQQLEQDLAAEKTVRETRDAELERTSAQLVELRREFQNVQRERTALTGQQDRILKENRELKNSNEAYGEQLKQLERQIGEVAAKLDVKPEAGGQLDRKVASLGTNIDRLRDDRSNLSSRITRLSGEVEQLRKERDQLAKDLEATKATGQKLDSQLKALTSNRNSLEANYIRTRNLKEQLETARALESALRTERNSSTVEGRELDISEVYLNKLKIGTLSVQKPGSVGEPVQVTFSVDSPDTVQFTPEERDWYASLGENFGVEIKWESWSPDIQPALLEGEPLQKIARREEGRWLWDFQGYVDQPAGVSLEVDFKDAKDQTIRLARQDFTVQPAGLPYKLRKSFSLIWCLAGVLAGGFLVVLFYSLRRHSPAGRRTYTTKDYPTQKSL